MSRSSVRRPLLACTVAAAISLFGAAPALAAPAAAPPDTAPPAAGAGGAAGTVTIPARWLEATAEEDWAQENPFIDCDSLAIRRPGCGSKDRGGWRQTLVFVVLLGGLAVVAGRITYAVRSSTRQRTADEQPAANQPTRDQPAETQATRDA